LTLRLSEEIKMIEPTDKTKYILRNWNPQSNQEETEYFDTIDEVTIYLSDNPMLPEDFTVYEISKEIKFKVVPA
jgi:hypothetical protein